MAAGPVTGIEVIAQAPSQLPGDLGGLEQIGQFQADALHLIRLPAVQASQVLDIGHGHEVVHLASADMEDADHGEALQTRKHARRGHRDFRRDEGDLVANPYAEFGGGAVADNDAKAARRQGCKAAFLEVIANDRDLGLFLGINGIDQHFLHFAVAAQQALHLHERRHRQHLRMLGHAGRQAAPVIDRHTAFHGGVGHHAEHAGAHLTVETIHHRQHDDHHQHAKGQADHRRQGDKGNEVVAALGARVTRTDENGQRSEHRRSIRWRKKRRPGRALQCPQAQTRDASGAFQSMRLAGSGCAPYTLTTTQAMGSPCRHKT